VVIPSSSYPDSGVNCLLRGDYLFWLLSNTGPVSELVEISPPPWVRRFLQVHSLLPMCFCQWGVSRLFWGSPNRMSGLLKFRLRCCVLSCGPFPTIPDFLFSPSVLGSLAGQVFFFQHLYPPFSRPPLPEAALYLFNRPRSVTLFPGPAFCCYLSPLLDAPPVQGTVLGSLGNRPPSFCLPLLSAVPTFQANLCLCIPGFLFRVLLSHLPPLHGQWVILSLLQCGTFFLTPR